MHVKDAIQSRRAYRSLETCKIDESLIRDLAEKAGLAPSCYNHQPWRMVFVSEKAVLDNLANAIPRGNQWTKAAAMIIAVFSKKEDDCVIKEREYFLFDTGMATAFLILRATELGLVAHPIAGFDEEKVKHALAIPKEMKLITLLVVGKRSKNESVLLNEKQRESERIRPSRKKFDEFSGINSWGD